MTGARHQTSTWVDDLDNTSPDILDLDDDQDLESVGHPAPQPVRGAQLQQQQQGEDHPEPHPTCTQPVVTTAHYYNNSGEWREESLHWITSLFI